jgi:hypothetical protein
MAAPRFFLQAEVIYSYCAGNNLFTCYINLCKKFNAHA